MPDFSLSCLYAGHFSYRVYSNGECCYVYLGELGYEYVVRWYVVSYCHCGGSEAVRTRAPKGPTSMSCCQSFEPRHQRNSIKCPAIFDQHYNASVLRYLSPSPGFIALVFGNLSRLLAGKLYGPWNAGVG